MKTSLSNQFDIVAFKNAAERDHSIYYMTVLSLLYTMINIIKSFYNHTVEHQMDLFDIGWYVNSGQTHSFAKAMYQTYAYQTKFQFHLGF